MKKFLILISLVFLAGCEKSFDEIIDATQSNYQVTVVSSFPSFTYTPDDSLISLRVVFRSSEDVRSVFGNIYSSENIKLNDSPINLFDNGRPENGDITAGDNIYSNRFPLSQNYPVGNYKIEYFVMDRFDVTKRIAVHNFTYNNGQSNAAPVISNDVIEPDTAIVNDTTVIFCSISVSDSNGANDIESVYFIVVQPDGDNVQLNLFDDGNINEHGDQIANDGIYSLLIEVNQNNDKGTYLFKFRARDRGKKLSNEIIHEVVIL